MLKRRKGLLSSGLTSSCRIKAEALARAFNSRIWPCTWVYRRSATDSDGADQDEEYFEASPSPSEDEDQIGLDRDCSAASEEGRAKLYELLQHHAVDDATDVFYDVSEHAGLSETVDRNVMQNLGILTDSLKLEIKCGEAPSDRNEGGAAKNVACATECSEKNCDSNNCDSDETSSSINAVEESLNLTLCSKCLNNDICKDLTSDCDFGGTSDIAGETSNNIGEISNDIGETSNDIGEISDNVGEASNNINTVYESVNLTNSSESSNDNFCKNISITCDSNEIPNNIDTVDKPANSIFLSKYLNNDICEDVLNDSESGETSNSINSVDETMKTCSFECLNNGICGDVLNDSESGETSNGVNSADETMKTCSFECLNNDIFKDFSNNCDSDETSKSRNPVCESLNLTCSYECLNNDICKDISVNCDSRETSKSLNIDDEYVHSTCLTKCLNNDNSTDLSEISNPKSMIVKDNSDGSSDTGIDFKGIDYLPFEKEEMLTVIIDSNSFKIHQTENRNFREVSLSNDEHTVNENNTSQIKSDFSIRNGEENKNLASESGDSVLIEVTNALNSPCENECTENGKLSPLDNPNSTDNCRLKVFTELRPMISRSTSLKTGKTPPGTPSRKKIVRFADVLGLDLEDVRHIISGDLPNIPSSAYNDLVLGDDTFPPTVSRSVTIHLNNRQKASWESGPGAAGPNAMYPLFAMPGQQPDFMDRVRSRGICLDSVVIADCNIQCTCRVMNWSFNKTVVARYTINRWFSSNDINASYVCDSTRDGTDSFAFSIFLTPQRLDVEFALRYVVNGKEYWDNNDGVNYCFSYSSSSNMPQSSVPSSPSWIHQFW